MADDTPITVLPERPAPVAVPPGVAHQAARPRFPGKIPGELGIWIFILGDMALYGILFCSFLVDRAGDPQTYNDSAATLHVTFGAVNTLLLLTSSLAVALGIRAAREQITSHSTTLFTVAIACGLGFVFNKYLEYSDLLGDDLDPTRNGFYTYYYVLTGIHLTHVLAGLGVLVFLRRVSRKRAPSTRDIRAMESAASFWHTVDLLWIVLFPMLYLVR